MKSDLRWLLPDGVEELLPPAAARLESLRRDMLDLLGSWGYELVMPPMLEYIESLLTGFGSDLDLQTLKVIDQLTGRLMGLRADVTSQAARIDAHSLRQDGVVRLCYAETVLHSRPSGPLGSRAPLVVGAELFGSVAPAADAEIICLMADALRAAGATETRIELGHVGIFRELAAAAALDEATTARLFAAVQMKSAPDVKDCLAGVTAPGWLKDALGALPLLMGDEQVLHRARALFAAGPRSLCAAIDYLTEVAALVRGQRPDIRLQFDLAELRGYGYHTGVVFAAYIPAYGRAVARGGRYDGIGAAFGRSRPATGFDADLKLLAALHTDQAQTAVITAPAPPADAIQASALVRKVDELRAQGRRVAWTLTPAADTAAPDREHPALVWRELQWTVMPPAFKGTDSHG